VNTDWPKVQLGDVLRQRVPDATVDPTETYNFAGVYSFARGVFRTQARRGSEFAYRRLTRLRKGEFVYPKLMAWEGAFGIVPEECDGCYVSPEFPVFECDPSLIRVEFLRAYFKAASVWKEISTGSKGLGHRRQRVQPVQILRHSIWVPPLAWQDRLAKVQAEVDQLKLLQAQTSAELDAMLPAVLNRAFKGEL
jgi:type I restriction enzyme S subunit